MRQQPGLRRIAGVAWILVLVLVGMARAQGDMLRRQADWGVSLSEPTVRRAGAEVRSVRQGSAAEKAGLRAGDRVLKINGMLLDSPVSFYRASRRLRGGDVARLEVIRDQEAVEFEFPLPSMPKEEFPGIVTEYGSVLSPRGYRVRTVLTRPADAQGRLPGIFFVPWMSCDTIEFPYGLAGGMVGIDILLHKLVTQSGMMFLRVERPGLGDSEGPPCIEADFLSGLDAFRAAFAQFRTNPLVDPSRIIVFAQSNGAGFAPLVTGDYPVAGYAVTGGWVKSWFEHMLHIERNWVELRGRDPAEVNRHMKKVAELYAEILIRKRTPVDVLAERPTLKEVWRWGDEHMYGLPISFVQQLQDLDLEGAWSKVTSPTLVLYGEYDWAMARDDHERIAALVRRNQPGLAEFRILPRTNHSLFVYDSLQQGFDDFGKGEFDESLVPILIDWMRETLARQP